MSDINSDGSGGGSFEDTDNDGVAELQDNHADFGGGDARNVGSLSQEEANNVVYADPDKPDLTPQLNDMLANHGDGTIFVVPPRGGRSSQNQYTMSAGVSVDKTVIITGPAPGYRRVSDPGTAKPEIKADAGVSPMLHIAQRASVAHLRFVCGGEAEGIKSDSQCYLGDVRVTGFSSTGIINTDNGGNANVSYFEGLALEGDGTDDTIGVLLEQTAGNGNACYVEVTDAVNVQTGVKFDSHSNTIHVQHFDSVDNTKYTGTVAPVWARDEHSLISISECENTDVVYRETSAGRDNWLEVGDFPSSAGISLNDDPTDTVYKKGKESNLLYNANRSTQTLSFDTWRSPNASRPVLVTAGAWAETDGTTPARVELQFDWDGNSTVDQVYEIAYQAATASGDRSRGAVSGVVPPGAQYRVDNSNDPNNGNLIRDVTEWRL